MKLVMMMATMNGNQAPAVNFFSVAEISVEGRRGYFTSPEDTVDETKEEEERQGDDEDESPNDVHDGCKKRRSDNHDTGHYSSVMRKAGWSDPSSRRHS